MSSKHKTEKYISFEEFINHTGLKESTIRRMYKNIPGIQKTSNGFAILSGTRYPFNMRGYKIKNSNDRRYILLKAISQYKYISHLDIRLESAQFCDMLRELLSAGLIKKNNLYNNYGANAYDCTLKGEEVLKQTRTKSRQEILNMVSTAAGKFTGAIISEIYNAS